MQRKKTKIAIKLPCKAWNKRHRAKVTARIERLPLALRNMEVLDAIDRKRSKTTPVEIIANRLTRVADAKAKRQLRNLHARARALISLEMA